jgi:hypothetical protein
VPRPRRAEAALAASLALALGCATAAPSTGLRPMDLPAAAGARSVLAARVDAGLPALMRALSERGREGYRALRLTDAQVDGWLRPDAISRARNTFVGMVPGANDRRWFAWRRWHGSALLGWCARGARVAEADGPEGFMRRTLVVDRLLVVGGRGEHRWAAWLEGLVLARDGWRFAPWVPHAQSVEAPRRSHPDVDLWDCDAARAPATSAPRPGG